MTALENVESQKLQQISGSGWSEDDSHQPRLCEHSLVLEVDVTNLHRTLNCWLDIVSNRHFSSMANGETDAYYHPLFFI